MSGTTTPTPTPDHESLTSPQTVIALATLAIVAATVAGVFIKGDQTVIDTVVGVVVGSGFGAIVGYYFGSAKGSQQKDQVLANLAQKSTPPPPP